MSSVIVLTFLWQNRTASRGRKAAAECDSTCGGGLLFGRRCLHPAFRRRQWRQRASTHTAVRVARAMLLATRPAAQRDPSIRAVHTPSRIEEVWRQLLQRTMQCCAAFVLRADLPEGSRAPPERPATSQDTGAHSRSVSNL